MIKILIVFCLIYFWAATNASAQSVKITPSKEYQEIRGFGGMSHTTWIRDLNEDNREKSFGNDPGEMGLSILRIHLDPNPDLFSRELPSALHAIQKGAIVFATPWNAPDAVLDKAVTESRVLPAKYGDYVAHLNSFNKYMADNGVSIYAISVQNEPDYGEWTRWTSNEMLNFMRDYAQNIENRVMAPESFQFRRTFTDPLLNDPKAVANLDIVGGHIYGAGLMDYPLAREKGKEVWMTEHLLGSNANETNDWNLALTVGKEINDCMKANFNAYVWWYIRRFYGLISDDGNITDKGYVIAHYSKFIRPGAIRVDASVTSAPLVDVTAYKTDTTFVVVVVNRDSKSVNLDFTIENSQLEKLTQFTSTTSKKLINEGNLAISEGSFSATVEAKSVTTFTSNAVNGGKRGNIKPTAFAGDDIIIDDADGKGSVTITLDGTTSNDTDGEIANYSWSLSGQQVAWTPNYELTVSIGEYDLVLTVTDNDGATSSDTIHISLSSSKSEEIWLEAECGTVGKSWQNFEDTGASEEKYVMTTDGVQSLASASTNPDDLLQYQFTTTEEGNYKVWGRVICPNANDDSYWVKVDESDWTNWNSIPAGTSWHWDDVHNQNNDNVVFYELESGEHTLSICMREDGAKLDKILISNTGIAPTDLGEKATNSCLVEEPNKIDRFTSVKGNFNVYPNPSNGQVKISWDKKFSSIKVFNPQGQIVYHKEFSLEVEKTKEKLELTSGVYFVILQNKNSSAIKKIIIK